MGMIKFSQFTEQERQFLSSVPYRVGYWISTCDDNTGSSLDDRREAQAMEVVITKISRMNRAMPFTSEVMKEIQNLKREWPRWSNYESEAQILEEVKKAIDMCHGKGAKRALVNYKRSIWQVAVAVAQSHGEQVDPDNEMHFDRFVAWIGSFVLSPKMTKTPENISDKEKTALKKLRAILKQ